MTLVPTYSASDTAATAATAGATDPAPPASPRRPSQPELDHRQDREDRGGHEAFIEVGGDDHEMDSARRRQGRDLHRQPWIRGPAPQPGGDQHENQR
ncbi:MAG: hypothetical protein ACRD29_11335 [Acidimicrobiales bacterium]